ncbi:hypothetical protein MH1LPH_23220 [Lactiplantibacillus brownii]
MVTTATTGSAATSVGSTATSASSITSGTTSTATSAATSTTSTASSQATTVPDATVVTFGDANMETAVQQALGVTGPITVGEIRNFNGTSLGLGTDGYVNVTDSFAGMQYLQYLPKTTLINMNVNIQDPTIDFTPLIPLRFSNITIGLVDMSAANLKPLTEIDPSQINEVQLDGQTTTYVYQQNSKGMTNAQLAMLGPWLTSIDNNDVTRNGFPKIFNFSDDSLTDFSPLKGFTKAAQVSAVGENQTLSQAVNIVIGQPAVFTPTPIIGLEGEDLSSHYEETWNGTDTTKYAATETPLTYLGHDEFEIPTPYQAVANANWFTYGFVGTANSTGNVKDDINLYYPGSVQFTYDSMIYQAANWQTAPTVDVGLIDHDTGKLIKPLISTTSPKIGDKYNFESYTTLPGYQFLPNESSASTGTYLQNPQEVDLQFVKNPVVAGGMTVEYLDPDNEPIVAPEQIHGNVGDPYTTTPATIGNYVFKQMGSNSAAMSGTLPLLKGTIVYDYAPVTVTRVINYVDAVTNKSIGQTTITVPYQGTLPDPTKSAIAGYEAKGYQLAHNGYPENNAAFTSAAPILAYRVMFSHTLVTLKPGETLPAGVDLTHAVKQTVQFKYADGKMAAPTVTRTIEFTREAVRDAVTGTVQYTTWKPVGTTTFEALTAPVIADYRADMTQVPATTVTETSPDLMQTITYQQTSGRVNVKYYLAKTDQTVKPGTEMTGKFAAPYDVAAPKIAGYRLVANEPETIRGHYTDSATTVAFYYEPEQRQSTTTGSTTKPTQSSPMTTKTTKRPAAKMTHVTAKTNRPTAKLSHLTTKTSRPTAKLTPVSVKSAAMPAQRLTSQSTAMTKPVAMAARIQPSRTTIRLTAPVAKQHVSSRQSLQPLTTARTLPQTSEQRPTDIWGLLALTMVGLFGGMRLRRRREQR